MKANLRKKCCRYLITFLSAIAVTAGLLIPAQIKAADSYDKDKKGSITINLDDVKLDDTVTNKEGVSVSVYQIASINHDRINISFDIKCSQKAFSNNWKVRYYSNNKEDRQEW